MKNRHILACIDAPDPDNLVMLVALRVIYPDAQIHVVLTGRPVKFHAEKGDPLWDWDMKSSLLALEASAARVKNFLRHFGMEVTRVYDGGIAPRTLVPHWIHFHDYYAFREPGHDPLAPLRHSELHTQDEIVRILCSDEVESFAVVVGGPMTGLAQILRRAPQLADKISELHAMFATWGNVQLMQMDDKPRGALQFNVACDPFGAHEVLSGLTCPIYLMPSEVTRVAEIGFPTATALRAALPGNQGTNFLMILYTAWYDAAVRPRQERNPDERIFIHDLVGALSLDPELREQLYEVVPIKIAGVPHLACDREDWGKIQMAQTGEPTNVFAATRLKDGGAQVYLQTLHRIFDQ